MGHIFQLGRKYAEALDLKVLDENGKLVTVTMGSYGIGASAARSPRSRRAPSTSSAWLAARASPRPTCTSWPPARTRTLFAAAERIASELSAQGIDVLYDDRPARSAPA